MTRVFYNMASPRSRIISFFLLPYNSSVLQYGLPNQHSSQSLLKPLLLGCFTIWFSRHERNRKSLFSPMKLPVGKWSPNDVVSTLIRRHFTSCARWVRRFATRLLRSAYQSVSQSLLSPIHSSTVSDAN